MKHKTEIRLRKKAAARCVLLTNKVFSNFYSTNGKDLSKAKSIISPYAKVIEAQLRWLAATDYFGADERTGEETYGYKDEQNILCNLMYISDRYNCQFRLRWALGILNH